MPGPRPPLLVPRAGARLRHGHPGARGGPRPVRPGAVRDRRQPVAQRGRPAGPRGAGPRHPARRLRHEPRRCHARVARCLRRAGRRGALALRGRGGGRARGVDAEQRRPALGLDLPPGALPRVRAAGQPRRGRPLPVGGGAGGGPDARRGVGRAAADPDRGLRRRGPGRRLRRHPGGDPARRRGRGDGRLHQRQPAGRRADRGRGERRGAARPRAHRGGRCDS